MTEVIPLKIFYTKDGKDIGDSDVLLGEYDVDVGKEVTLYLTNRNETLSANITNLHTINSNSTFYGPPSNIINPGETVPVLIRIKPLKTDTLDDFGKDSKDFPSDHDRIEGKIRYENVR